MKETLVITLLVLCQYVGAQCDVTLSTPGYNGSDVSCTGMCNANIFSNYSGTAPYTFAWSTGENSSNLYDRCAGIYILTLTDNTGCVAVDSLEIIEPSEIVAEIFVSQPLSIYSSCGGELYGTPTGGTLSTSFPWYEYSWFDCITGQPFASESYNLQDLCAGNYGVVITDGNGCIDSACFTLNIDTCAFVSANYFVGGLDCYMGVSGNFPIDSYQWVNCNDGFSPFPGDTLEYYSSGTSNYVAVIFEALGCIDTSYCAQVCYWGLEELNFKSKEVFRIIDPMGNEIPEKPNTFMIYLYNDGTSRKVFVVE